MTFFPEDKTFRRAMEKTELSSKYKAICGFVIGKAEQLRLVD